MGISTSVEYAIDRHWVLATDITWDHRNGTRIHGYQCSTTGLCGDVDHQRGPHWTYSVAPAVEYNFSASLGLIMGAQFSVSGHNADAYWAPQAALNMAF
jgi:hypothetical protein